MILSGTGLLLWCYNNRTEKLFPSDIFSLRDQFTEIHYFSTQILSIAILSLHMYDLLSAILNSSQVHCTLRVYGFQYQENNMTTKN